MADQVRPFLFEASDIHHSALAVRRALLVCKRISDAKMEGRPIQDAPGVAGASVKNRQVVSIATQAMWKAGAEGPASQGLDLGPFNVLDGLAHGIACVLAQQPDPQAALMVFAGQLQGYVDRLMPVAQAIHAEPKGTA